MGSAGKMFTQIGKATGVLKENKFVQGLANPAAVLAAGGDPTDAARKGQLAERTQAAKRRARRAGRRGLMMAGRLGGGGQEKETKTTLGA